jgi:hypothetical protein
LLMYEARTKTQKQFSQVVNGRKKPLSSDISRVCALGMLSSRSSCLGDISSWKLLPIQLCILGTKQCVFLWKPKKISPGVNGASVLRRSR